LRGFDAIVSDLQQSDSWAAAGAGSGGGLDLGILALKVPGVGFDIGGG